MNKVIVIPDWGKSLIGIGGILLLFVGLQIGLGVLCRAARIYADEPEQLASSFLIFTLALSMLGTGGALAWHSLASLQKKRSAPLSLPDTGPVIGVLILYAMITLLFPESFFVFLLSLPLIAVLPPMLAISWFRGKQADNITWRRSIIVFTVSGLLSLICLFLGQGLLYFVVLSLQPDLTGMLLVDISAFFEFARSQHLLALIYLALLAILITELIKPLATLPFLPQLNRREAFIIGAIAGAGFAPIAAIFYGSLAFDAHLLLLMLTVLGAAVHPFSSGLVTLGWYDLREKPSGWPGWLAYYGVAVAIQVVWNLGFLILVTLNHFPTWNQEGPGYFVSQGVDWLIWLSTWVALLGVGVVAWWGGWTLTRLEEQGAAAGTSPDHALNPERSIAIWAAACFVGLAPVGVVILYLLQ